MSTCRRNFGSQKRFSACDCLYVIGTRPSLGQTEEVWKCTPSTRHCPRGSTARRRGGCTMLIILATLALADAGDMMMGCAV